MARALHRAAPGLAWAWWILVVIRGALPAVLAVAIGVVVGAVNDGAPLGWPLAAASIALAAMQILPPLHQAVGANLGSCTANWLNGELTDACINPPGVGHLEDPELVDDLVTARDFDLGIMGPPLYISMDFIASGLVDLLGGLAAAIVLVRFAWWAPIVLCVAWGCTHWLLRESGVWRDRQTPPVQLRPAPCRLRLPPRCRRSRLEGGARLRPRRLGGRSVRRLGPPAARPEVGGDAAARALAGVVPADRGGGERAGVLGDRRRRVRRDASASAPRSRSPRPRSPPACSPSAA